MSEAPKLNVIVADSSLAKGRFSISVLKNLVDSDLARFNSLKEIASALQVSTETLRKNYRMESGETVSQLIANKQATVMKELLANTALPCEEIGKACGFRRSDSACRFFRQNVGMRMTEYRRMEFGKKSSI